MKKMILSTLALALAAATVLSGCSTSENPVDTFSKSTAQYQKITSGVETGQFTLNVLDASGAPQEFMAMTSTSSFTESHAKAVEKLDVRMQGQASSIESYVQQGNFYQKMDDENYIYIPTEEIAPWVRGNMYKYGQMLAKPLTADPKALSDVLATDLGDSTSLFFRFPATNIPELAKEMMVDCMMGGEVAQQASVDAYIAQITAMMETAPPEEKLTAEEIAERADSELASAKGQYASMIDAVMFGPMEVSTTFNKDGLVTNLTLDVPMTLEGQKLTFNYTYTLSQMNEALTIEIPALAEDNTVSIEQFNKMAAAEQKQAQEAIQVAIEAAEKQAAAQPPATDSSAPATDSNAPATDSSAPVADSGTPATPKEETPAPIPEETPTTPPETTPEESPTTDTATLR